MLNNIESMIRQMPGFVALKTVDSTYAAANDLCAQLAGYKNVESYLGTSDYDWKCEAVEIADDIRAQDKLVLETQNTWQSFNILKFSNNSLTYYLSTKSLLRDTEGKILGILFIGTILTDATLLKILTPFTQNNPLEAHKKIQCSVYPIIKNHQDELKLSRRQLECLFYLLRGKSAKEIGLILDLSSRTIEMYLEHIKDKFRCATKSELIEKAIEKGYFYYLPDSIVHK
jgi:DNA-binding CsgD family transcriptional regulator